MRLFHHMLLLASMVVAISACGPAPASPSSTAPNAAATSVPFLQEQTGLFEEQPTSTVAPATVASAAAITIDTTAAPTPIDQRLFGTNLPAWLRARRLRDPKFQQQVKDLGTTLVRMPGGSWSNHYDWLACENRDTAKCFWPWAARPSDFIGFLRATGVQGMWTVSVNGTAQEAAALVAFFNGAVDDSTVIGVDLHGQDWKTVGHWAQLRADHGNPAPAKIVLWEVGNEVYGGKPTSGPNCAAWGWEDVWTCDGTEYVRGIGTGSTAHEGYLAVRTAMRAVDPQIQVGAVGVAVPSDWSNWGTKVIAAAGTDLDFYVVHRYAYDKPPRTSADALAQPQQIWPRMAADLETALGQDSKGRKVPIALTEYNMFAFQDADTGQLMRQAVNALYTADTLGQLAQHGVTIANQWNLANGQAKNGTDYGLLDAETSERLPASYAFPLWRAVGNALLPVVTTFATDTTLSVYAGRSDGALTLLAINKTASPISAHVQLDGDTTTRRSEQTVVGADSLAATTMTINGVKKANGDIGQMRVALPGTFAHTFEATFAPFSITLIRMPPA